MRYFITFTYRGTDFHGSQTQPNGNTVQAEMEKAFATILRAPVALTFAGRTDAGVHADMMVAHFDVEKAVPANFAARLNNLLPDSIAIRDLQRVTDEAHARFDALERTYHYRITMRKDPFTCQTRTRIGGILDFTAMNEAAKSLLGQQDFASFCRVHTDVKTTICDVREARWVVENENEAYFVITADRFLRNMVRAIVGTLFDIGRGKMTKAQLEDIIATKDRCKAGHSAPAEGLSLVEIKYPKKSIHMRKMTLLLLVAALLSACAKAPQFQTTTQSEMNRLTKAACFEMPKVTVPSFPNRTFNILDYGADPTGVALATEAIQKAIDECTEAGGGTVIIPEGIYLTAPITLKSNVRLFTERNSVIIFSHDLDLYEIYDEWFEGIPTKRCTSPLNALDAENIAITGHGTFNGNGDWWRPLKKSKMAPGQWKKHLKEKGGIVDNDIWYPDSASLLAQSYCLDQNVPVITDDSLWQVVKSFLRPVLLHFVGCKNILLEGVTFENSPAWNLHPMCCENLILNHLNVRNPWYSQNGDGVDVESCKNVVISHCSFDVGDDAICMKSGKDKPGRDRGIPTENVVVDDCVVYHGHGGFVCGSEMSGGIKNVQVSNNLYIGTDVGLRFKSTRGRGGVVENIYINGVNMVNIPNEGLLFDLFYGGKGAGEETEEELAARMNAEAPAVSEETPAFKNIVIENVKGSNIKRAIYFNGLPEMKIQNVTLRNIAISATEGALFRQTDGLIIDNVDIKPEKGEAFSLAPTVENVKIN